MYPIKRVIYCGLALASAVARAADASPAPADLYQMNKVWTAKLAFTALDWKAMEPERTPIPEATRTATGRMNLVAGEGSRNGLALSGTRRSIHPICGQGRH